MKKQIYSIIIIISILFYILNSLSCIRSSRFDIVIYGGTPSGIIAAVQASNDGMKAVIIEPSNRIGGLTTGGLGMTDHGKKSSIGGLSLNFYNLVAKKYNKNGPAWSFEPSVALKVFQEMIIKSKIPVYYNERLDLKQGVSKKRDRIFSIKMESGKVFKGKIFIDASYEGDLMAKSGVTYVVGREPNYQYGEMLNGIVGREHHLTIPKGVDPYVKPGDPNSGLLLRVNPNLGGNPGDGDNRIMAYCYRMCLTNDPTNRLIIDKPEGYNEQEYELLFRSFEKGLPKTACFQLTPLPNKKTDSNMASGISTNYIGGNLDYPDADYETRNKIEKAHEIYQKGFVWTVQNHPRVPLEVRNYYKEWGLAKDEFIENGNWPQQLYIRESRRMLSDYVITEKEVFQEKAVSRSIGLASYNIDSHPVQYCVGEDGFVRTEGGTMKRPPKAYQLDYGIIVPKKNECKNLLVPVCVSASHSAYTSLRMEPVYMILGQSAASVASLAIKDNIAVQDIEYSKLRERLIEASQILDDNDENNTWFMDDSGR